MKNKWKEINYIEICSGPGRCINRCCSQELDGTALSIIKHSDFCYIHKALFFDYDEKVVDILNRRIKNMEVDNAMAIIADYNNPKDLCSILQRYCSYNSLNLVLVDPTDCSVPFDLIVNLKKALHHIDMIINVATGTDFSRNIPMAFDNTERAKKYINFLGDDSFFSSSENQILCKNKNYSVLRNNFREAYQKSMSKIGYSEFRITQIKHYYDILLASSNKKATEFWDKAQNIEFDGQRELF
jgi:three-Cys-motif partner protein